MKILLKSLFFTSLFVSQLLFATTLQKLSFEELVDMSELVFEGEVASVNRYESGRLIYTRVLFTVDDVLKGVDPGNTIELVFLGGEYGGRTVKVSGQDIPLDGERGIYFVESTDRDAVNPLAGWSQGHFRILTDDKGYETLDKAPEHTVMEISDNKNAILANKLRNMRFSRKLVDEAFYMPATPDELRRAVREHLTKGR